MADFRVQAELFGRLKGKLLPLGRRGEVERFAAALELCDRGLRHLDMATVLNDQARSLVGAVDDALDTRALKVQPGGSIWTLKAKHLSGTERMAFARTVDGLAEWFDQQPKPVTARAIARDVALTVLLDALWSVFDED